MVGAFLAAFLAEGFLVPPVARFNLSMSRMKGLGSKYERHEGEIKLAEGPDNDSGTGLWLPAQLLWRPLGVAKATRLTIGFAGLKSRFACRYFGFGKGFAIS